MNDVTIILGYRKSLPDKESNLNFVLAYYTKNYPKSEIIVVEQDITPKFKREGVKHIFVYNSGLYNRSWSFNIGMNHAKNEKILFADIDCFFGVDISPIANKLNQYDVVIPFTEFYQLDKHSTLRTKANSFESPLMVEQILYVNAGAGVLFANKSKVKEIGGWSEEFEGWGGEDDVFSIKVKHKLTYIQTQNPLFHLYHERNNSVSSNGHEKYEQNRKLALEIVPRMNSKQLDEYIEEGKINNVGKEDKYKVVL
jgi:predicted glycosyltransferase involved in capsule biosynthesis